MLNETFYIDGIDARSAGIQLQSPIEFSEAVPVVEAQTIPGRNGDLIFETGSYENRSAQASCFCLQDDVEKAISSAGRFLMGKKGYRRLETSDDPNHYWMARVESSPNISMRLRKLAPFDINFDCKPQRFLKEGEEAITFNTFDDDSVIFNPYGFDALPFITVYGAEWCKIQIGEFSVEIHNVQEFVHLDCDMQNAYNRFGLQNSEVYAEKFPVLVPGESKISISGGVGSIEIIPRWWEL